MLHKQAKCAFSTNGDPGFQSSFVDPFIYALHPNWCVFGKESDNDENTRGLGNPFAELQAAGGHLNLLVVLLSC